MKNSMRWFVLFLAVFVITPFGFAKDEGAVTQGELAKTLAERMSLEPDKTTPGDYTKALEQQGIKPAAGWDAAKPVTPQDLGSILVGAGRLQAESLSGKDTNSILKEQGIILPSRVNRASMDKLLQEPAVSKLLEAPSLSGPSVPYPKEGLTVIPKATPQLPEDITVPPAEMPEPELVPMPEPPPPEPDIKEPTPSEGGSR